LFDFGKRREGRMKGKKIVPPGALIKVWTLWKEYFHKKVSNSMA